MRNGPHCKMRLIRDSVAVIPVLSLAQIVAHRLGNLDRHSHKAMATGPSGEQAEESELRRQGRPQYSSPVAGALDQAHVPPTCRLLSEPNVVRRENRPLVGFDEILQRAEHAVKGLKPRQSSSC